MLVAENRKKRSKLKLVKRKTGKALFIRPQLSTA